MTRQEALVIGTSAGGVEILSLLIRSLKPSLSTAVIVVLHQLQHNASRATELFRTMTSLPVEEAEEKTKCLPRHIYFAPPGYHLLIEKNHSFSLSTEEPVNYSRPSIDVLFSSAAEAYEAKLMGLVLTGANNDGAQGLKAIHSSGGKAFVQDPQTARYSIMPQAALDLVPEARALSLENLKELMAGL